MNFSIRTLAYGTMGGDGQPQTQAQIYTRHVGFGQDLGPAIAAPCFVLGQTWGDADTNLKLEAGFDESGRGLRWRVRSPLRRQGHGSIAAVSAETTAQRPASRAFRPSASSLEPLAGIFEWRKGVLC